MLPKHMPQSSCPLTKSARLGKKSPNPMMYNITYIGKMPLCMHPYVDNNVDVARNGNCEFCVIVALLGKRVESLSTIRLDLIKQLTTHHNEYVDVFWTEFFILHKGKNRIGKSEWYF